MNVGLVLSLLLHAFVLAWALFSFETAAKPKPPEIVPVEVALISPDDLIRLRQGSRDSKNLETKPDEAQVKPQEKKSKDIRRSAAPPPDAAPPPPVVPIKPMPKPADKKADEISKKLAALEKAKAAEEARLKAAAEAKQKAEAEAALKRAEAEAEAKKKAEAEAAKKKAEAEAKRKAEEEARKAAEAKRKAEEEKKAAEAKKREEEERRKAEELRRKKLAEAKRRKERRRKLAEKKRRERNKKQFDPDKISALLNKIPDAKAPPSGSKPRPNQKRNLPRGPAAGAPEGHDSRLTASQRSLLGVMMKKAVSECWRVQTGMRGADQLVVDIEVRLKPDGSIEGEPRVVNRRSGALYADAATNALRALEQCAPYSVLPPELYKGGWDHMVVTFDPQKMF